MHIHLERAVLIPSHFHPGKLGNVVFDYALEHIECFRRVRRDNVLLLPSLRIWDFDPRSYLIQPVCQTVSITVHKIGKIGRAHV